MLLQAHPSPLSSSPSLPNPGEVSPASDAPRPKLTLLASAPCAVPRVLRELVGRRPAQGGVVVVVDADGARREASARRLWRFLSGKGIRGWVVVATGDARRALPGSSLVLALPTGRSRTRAPIARKVPAARPSVVGSAAPDASARRRPGRAAPPFPPQFRRACAELCPDAVLLVDAGPVPRQRA